MGIVRLEETQKAELEEFRRMLLSRSAVYRRKGDDGFGGEGIALPAENGDVLDRMVCVTSGVSYLGIAIVNQLLVNGYSVRIIVDNEEDVDKLREMEVCGEMRLTSSIVEVVMANLTEVESLTEAFEGCRGVFHTAAFLDPAGLSGYSLWYALGKLRAEKAAWEIAKESGLKLATICAGLITGSDFYKRNPTPTIAYLKGVQEMYVNGLLATINIDRLAKAHVCVFEEMKKNVSGRYICFDKVIERADEIEKLAAETGLSPGRKQGLPRAVTGLDLNCPM